MEQVIRRAILTVAGPGFERSAEMDGLVSDAIWAFWLAIARNKYDPTKSRPETFVVMIVRRLWAKRCRHQAVERGHREAVYRESPTEQEAADNRAEGKDESERESWALREAWQELTAEERELLGLRHSPGATPTWNEIAALQAKIASTLRSEYCRILRKLCAAMLRLLGRTV